MFCTLGSRARTTFQFGYIALDLLSLIFEDSGEYLCRVVSSTGVAESRAILRVTGMLLVLNLNF